MSPLERLLSKIDKRGPTECWPWIGGMGSWGYGSFYINRKNYNASRAAYILMIGPIESSLVVRHTCDNPACCNPAHLIPGTQAENLKDCRDRKRARYLTGEAHHRSTRKLTDAQVREVKSLSRGGLNNCQIARRFGVNNTTIRSIVIGDTWKHIV
jgi:HNH endonuclease